MNNLILYGSYARGDTSQDSDVDLLSIGERPYATKIVQNHVNLSIYSFSKLKGMAEEGSLFVYHLKMEGRILVDNGDQFSRLFSEHFRLKASYAEQLYFVRQLFAAIYDRYAFAKNVTFAHSKIAWCVRTVCAACGAEDNTPIFSPDAVESSFGKNARRVLGIKRRPTRNFRLLDDAFALIERLTEHVDAVDISDSLQRYKQTVLKGIESSAQADRYDIY